MKHGQIYLSDWIDSLQEKGRLFFTKEEAINTLQPSENAFRMATSRLLKKDRIRRILKGFYTIIPLEYRSAGGLPPSSYIDPLMDYLELPYYVGLLSAAAIYGASHQAAQEFQVVTSKPLRMIKAERGRIRFLTKKFMDRTPTKEVKVPTGFMGVSTPEATALDLIYFAKSTGGLNHVATVLNELAPEMNESRLKEVAAVGAPDLASVQRLGFLLDHLGFHSLTRKLQQWIVIQPTQAILLRPQRLSRASLRSKDNAWKVIQNTEVEVDI